MARCQCVRRDDASETELTALEAVLDCGLLWEAFHRGRRADFGFDAEFLVVAVAVDFVLAHLDEYHAGGGVHFGVRRQPHFAVNFRLLEDEVGALVERREQAAANFHRCR